MADDISREQFFEKFKEQFENFNNRFNTTSNLWVDVKNILKNSKKSDYDFYKSFENNSKESKLYRERIEKSFKELEKYSKEASIGQKKQAIQRIQSDINRLPNSFDKQILEAQSEMYQSIYENQEKYRFSLIGSIKGLTSWINTTTIATTAIQTFGGVLNASAGSFQLTSSLLNSGANLASQGLNAFAGSLALLAKNPIGAVIASVFQSLVSLFTKGSKEVLKLVNEQVIKMMSSFQTISSAGVTFNNGLLGLRTAVEQTGLTMEQFSGAIKQNASTIADAGFGVSEGAKKISKVLENIRTGMDKNGRSLNDQLLNLGFTFEEQVSLAAETMAQMRRTGRTFQQGGEDELEIAQRTAEYAKNLRIIADLTGRDAKQKLEQARQITDNIAFNQKLRDIAKERGMSEEETSKFIQDTQNSLAKLPEFAQQTVKQQLVYGTAVGDTAKALAQLPTEMQSSFSSITNAIRSGGENMTTALSAVNDSMAKLRTEGPGSILAAISAAGELGGGLSSVSGLIQGLFNETLPRFKGGLESITNSVGGAAATSDEMTQGFREAQKAEQNLRIEAEKLATKGLKKFGETLKDTADLIKDAFKYLNEENKGGSSAVSPTSSTLATQKATSALGVTPGGLGPPPGVDLSAHLQVNPRDRREKGGPMEKGTPTLVGEKGPELVVPSENKMVIPNQFNLDPVIKTMQEQNRIGTEMVRYMKSMVDAQEKLIRASS